MRLALAISALCALGVAACGATTSSTSTTSTTTTVSETSTSTTAAAATPANWFFCDGIDAPTVMLFTGNGETNSTTTMTAYDKSAHGHAAAPVTYTVGEGDGAMGSVYTPLQINGQDAGHVRQANPGMFETPSAAYTTPYISVSLGDKEVQCRWLPRTRLMGFSDRRTFAVTEDAHGGLVYTTWDFGRSVPATLVAENGQTQPASLTVTGGHENAGTFTFTNNGYRYEVSVQNGAAQVAVFHGDQAMQTEHLTAYTTGTAASAQYH